MLTHFLRSASQNKLPLTYVTSLVNSSTTSRNTETYSSANIGTESNNRWVLVVVVNYNATGGATFDVTSITIGGVNATINTLRQQGTAANGVCLTFGWLQVTTGTTANIVVNYAGNIAAQTAIGIYNLNTNRTFTTNRVNASATTTTSAALSTNQSSTNQASHIFAWFRFNTTITAQSGGTLNFQQDIRTSDIFILRSVSDVTGTQTFSVTSSSTDSGVCASQMRFELS